MTKVLKEMRESNAVTKISLRKNDEFKELCEEINMVINQFIQTDQTTNSQQNKNKQESA
jgi:signal transduction histidine kinase